MISSYNILVPINSLDTMPFVGLFLSTSEKNLVTLAVNINSYLRETVFWEHAVNINGKEMDANEKYIFKNGL